MLREHNSEISNEAINIQHQERHVSLRAEFTKLQEGSLGQLGGNNKRILLNKAGFVVDEGNWVLCEEIGKKRASESLSEDKKVHN